MGEEKPVTIRQAQVDKILQNRVEFYAARDAGDRTGAARAAAAWRAAMDNATLAERAAAIAQRPGPRCRLCDAPIASHVERWGRYCSQECARVHGEWLKG